VAKPHPAHSTYLLEGAQLVSAWFLALACAAVIGAHWVAAPFIWWLIGRVASALAFVLSVTMARELVTPTASATMPKAAVEGNSSDAFAAIAPPLAHDTPPTLAADTPAPHQHQQASPLHSRPGARSHTMFMTRLAPDIAFASRHGPPRAVAMFDIHRFHALNATYG
jgi:hypothetical protein